jgi:hypothetical protein
MTRNTVIEISLAEESSEKANKELEREISEELSENTRLIPWAAKVERTNIKGILVSTFHNPYYARK